jgi:hypothetical protein
MIAATAPAKAVRRVQNAPECERVIGGAKMKIVGLFHTPGQAQSKHPPPQGPEAHERAILRLEESLARSQADFATCLDFLQDPDRLETSIRLTRLLIDRELPISDSLHELLLRAQLRHEPYRLDLTASLIGLLLKKDSAIVPVPIASAPPAADALADLVALGEAAAEKGDTVHCYAAFWQAAIQHPASPGGWAAFAAALAARRNWRDARHAARRAVEAGAAADPAAAGALLEALNLMAEHEELQDIDAAAFVSSLPAALEARPEAVSILLKRGGADGKALVPAMLAAHPDRWKASLIGALAAFDESDFESAYRHFRRAFEQNASETLREVVTLYSSPISQTIRILGVADELADWLSEHSSALAIETLISPSASPEDKASVRAARRRALERGLPSVFFVAHGKTASTSIGNIFSSGFGLPTAVYSLIAERVVAPWLREYQRGGACYVTHLKARPISVDMLAAADAPNIIVHVRDPRQSIVSIMEHRRRYLDQVPVKERAYYTGDTDMALRRALEIALPQVVTWLDGWVDARARLKIDFTRYEDFVNSREAFIERIIDLYGGDRRYFDREAAMTEHRGIDYHRRLGSTDEWRRRLSPAQIDLINRAIPPHFWGIFNWSD